jgi:hypothetical protein
MKRDFLSELRTAALVTAWSLTVVLVCPNARAQTRPSSEENSEARLQTIIQRLNRMEAVKAVERLQYTYGYYQDRFLFAEVLSLFSNDAPEAHYMGGVWKGQTSLKRLWLGYISSTYANGAVGPVAGRLFDMPQWQGVIDISSDSRTAKGRFRTLGKYAVLHEKEEWIAGIYDNDYVQEDGVWKIKVYRFCSPWSADYFEAWQDIDAAKRAPQWVLYPKDPNGPDRLETAAERCTDQYPNPGLVPFRFNNPVTGKPVTWASQ